MIWAHLVHLSFNMWEDRIEPSLAFRGYRSYLRFDAPVWGDILQKMAHAGMNMVVIDLGDGVQYRSHPEIAVENAWTVETLKQEISRVRDLGMEPIPKLNFATTHDAWMGDYGRRVSTDEYYTLCSDLIEEVIGIFDGPRFFHLGMDEETADHQRYFHHVVVRQNELYWHDFHFLCECVTKADVRPWVWSDYVWHHPDLFYKEMSPQVLQSNWYYRLEFGDDNPTVKTYNDLDEHGYDQIPTGSNHLHPESFGMTVDYCKRHIATEHLLGFLQTTWMPTTEQYRQIHLEAIDRVSETITA